MQRLKITTEKKHEQHDNQPLLPLFNRVRTRIYALSPLVKLKDFGMGIASLKLALNKSNHSYDAIKREMTQLNHSIKGLTDKQQSASLAEGLEQISHQHKVELSFLYPVMNPAATNQSHLKQTYASITKTMEKLQRTLANQQIKYDKKKSAKGKINIENHTQRLKDSARHEIAFFEKQASNRKAMLALLENLTMPTTFKIFMAEINKLSIDHKRILVKLLNTKEQLPHKREATTAPYELMFTYNAAQDDFMVGIRSHYDHDHPHPTIIGGEDPEAIVAGTIDLQLKEEILKVVKIRIDSGHYKPEAESFELIMRYIHRELNPTYYEHVSVGMIEDNSSPDHASPIREYIKWQRK